MEHWLRWFNTETAGKQEEAIFRNTSTWVAKICITGWDTPFQMNLSSNFPQKILEHACFPHANLWDKKLLDLTYNEENLHGNVTDRCAPSCGQVLVANEAHIVRNCHGNIKRRQQNEPVPASFESAEMQQDELGFLCIRNLILWKCRFIYKHILLIKT